MWYQQTFTLFAFYCFFYKQYLVMICKLFPFLYFFLLVFWLTLKCPLHFNFLASNRRNGKIQFNVIAKWVFFFCQTFSSFGTGATAVRYWSDPDPILENTRSDSQALIRLVGSGCPKPKPNLIFFQEPGRILTGFGSKLW